MERPKVTSSVYSNSSPTAIPRAIAESVTLNGASFLKIKKLVVSPSMVALSANIISVNDAATNVLVGNYLPNPNNGRFIMILNPGKYNVSIEATGMKTIEKTIEVLDKSSFQPEIILDIELTK